MKFSIITPTYKRADKLHRAIDSVIAQSHADWEMIVINDTPKQEGYAEIETYISNETRITYIANEENSGVNYSRNAGLQHISPDSDWVIFLDDDDYFAPDALKELKNIAEKKPGDYWIVTARGFMDGTSLTIAPKDDYYYNYARDYLILRHFKGDATHCIKPSLLKKIQFSTNIKQGEEWIFYFQLGMQTEFYFRKLITTLSDGYDAEEGLNLRKRTRGSRYKDLMLLTRDGWNKGCFRTILFPIYLIMRSLRILFLP